MFKKMIETLKAKMDNGCGGYEWNSDVQSFYDAVHEMALAEIITAKQWKMVIEIVKTVVE